MNERKDLGHMNITHNTHNGWGVWKKKLFFAIRYKKEYKYGI
jgi:hypothetical protein